MHRMALDIAMQKNSLRKGLLLIAIVSAGIAAIKETLSQMILQKGQVITVQQAKLTPLEGDASGL